MVNYKDEFTVKLNSINESLNRRLDEANGFLYSIDINEIDDLSLITSLYKSYKAIKSNLESTEVKFDISSIKDKIDEQYNKRLEELENQSDSLMLEFKEKYDKLLQDKVSMLDKENERIREFNNSLKESTEEYNSRIETLEIKRQKLLEYSDDILNICVSYGIKISDIQMDSSTFSMEELDLLYDDFYKYISSNINAINPISWIREKLEYNPTYLGVTLVGILGLCFTKLFDWLGIAFIAYLFYIQFSQKNKVKKYSIMAGLAFNVIPTELGLEKDCSNDLMEEVSTEIDAEADDDFVNLIDELNKSMEQYADDDLKEEIAEFNRQFTNDYYWMKDALNSVIDSFNKERSGLIIQLEELSKALQEKEKELRSKVKLLGTEFSEYGVLDTVVKLGLDKTTMQYETRDLGMRNIVIKRKGNDINEIEDFIKVLLANYYCNVRPGFFDCTVYDPNGMGRSMAGFYNENIEQVFHIATNNLDVILNDLRDYTDIVIKKTRGKDINGFNAEMVKQERLTLEYKLLIVMSQPKTVEEDEALSKFISYSAELGVFVWMISDKDFPNTTVFNKPFEGIQNPIAINSYDFPVEVMDNLHKAFEALKSPSLLWNDFRSKTIPEESYWSYSTDEFIRLAPGFEDGDPTKFRGYTVGNSGDVHALCVGGTGAGKSVFINNLIGNLTSMYSPKELRLWLTDFKGTEFNFYLKRPEIGQPYMLPHIDACLCTSDPDYSVSLFRAFRNEADSRYKFLKKKGFTDMFKYNTAMRKAGKPEECLPRVLFIVDEFQVIFEKTDGKAQAQLKADITQIAKVARAAGFHMLFCSQSMSGTMSGDILSQYTLRFGLRCPMDVSMAIMGTKYSGDIREKNGYLYVASMDDKKKELQKRYRTPFIPPDQLRTHIEYVAKRAEDENMFFEEAISYDEADVHQLEEVDGLFDKLHKMEQDTSQLFILGERMVYSTEGRRSNIYLNRENNQHIFSVFSNTKDMVMFFKTMMKNIERNGESKCIFNSQVDDLAYLCEMDKYITNENEAFSNNENMKPLSMIELFENIYFMRKLQSDLSSLKPLYIFLIGWDKSSGFGIDANFKLQERYSTLLQMCAVTNIHFIFLCSSQGDIPKSIINACAFRIAGKCDEKSSMTLLAEDKASKNYDTDDGYMFLYKGGVIERLKIYQSVLERKLKARSLRI